MAGEVANFDQDGFRAALLRQFSDATDVVLTVAAASVRVDARLIFATLLAANAARTTITNTPKATMQISWFGTLNGGAGLVLTVPPTATVSLALLAAPSPPPPLPPKPSSPVPGPVASLPSPPSGEIGGSTESQEIGADLASCAASSNFIFIAGGLLIAALAGLITAYACDRTKPSKGRESPQRAESLKDAFMDLHSLPRIVLRAWPGLTRSQSLQIVVSSFALEVALACAVFSFEMAGLTGGTATSIIVVGALNSVITTATVQLLRLFFNCATFSYKRQPEAQYPAASSDASSDAPHNLSDIYVVETKRDTGASSKFRSLFGLKPRSSNPSAASQSPAFDPVAYEMEPDLPELSLRGPDPGSPSDQGSEFASAEEDPGHGVGIDEPPGPSPPSSPPPPGEDAATEAVPGRNLIKLVLRWSVSWALLLALLAFITISGCQLFGQQNGNVAIELGSVLLSWAWSAGQRLLVNEPLLILLYRVAMACCRKKQAPTDELNPESVQTDSHSIEVASKI